MDGILTLVLAGGQGDRLRPLTERRAKPAVPFAGRRIIDFTLVNCERSMLRDVVVLAQYESGTVRRHMNRIWRKRLDSLTVFSSDDVGSTFRGTADAVRALLARNRTCDRLIVLAGDHVYRMDYRLLLADHLANRADATLSVVPVPRAEACNFGVVAVGREGVVEAFVEKPRDPPVMESRPDLALASMGIYVFEREALDRYLTKHPEAIDFGHDVMPGMLEAGYRIAAHDFGRDGSGYWRDIADLDVYHGTLMDLVSGFFDPGLDWPVPVDAAAPTRFAQGPGLSAPGVARDSWIGPGSVLAGGLVEHSVLGIGVLVEHHAEVVESVLLDGVIVGAHARLRRVVVDEGVRIPAGAVIGFGAEAGAHLRVTEGGIVYVGHAAAEAPERAPHTA